MAKREDLRKSRKGTIINVSSQKMESLLVKSLANTISLIEKEFEVPKTPDDVIKYNFAKTPEGGGFKGSFADFIGN